jgi:murein DD-endopeptidase MepM/ murein hydrolase activator NlpD
MATTVPATRHVPAAHAARLLIVLMGVLVGAVLTGARATAAPVAAAPATAAPVAAAPVAATWTWPLPGPREVVRPFDPPATRYGPGHRGVDLAAQVGSPVLAAGAGTVGFAGPVAGRGVITVLHPNGLRTTYEPVRSTLHPGEPVARGDRIGSVVPGHPGCPRPACLHWGLRRGDTYLDPLTLMGPTEVRLLPHSGRVTPDGVTAATGVGPTVAAAVTRGTTAADPGTGEQRWVRLREAGLACTACLAAAVAVWSGNRRPP